MLSYVLCAATFLALLILTFTRWRARCAGSGIAAVFAAQVAWSAFILMGEAGVAVPLGLFLAIEYLRGLAWAYVLAKLLARSADPAVGRGALRVLAGIAVAAVLASAGSLIAGGSSSAHYFASAWLWGGLTISILGLVLVEQVARNTRRGGEWRLRYVWLAVGALFTFDLCLYSISLLKGAIDQALWTARGPVNALLGVLFAIGLQRIQVWQAASLLSPRVVFFNAALLACAAYVLAMAAVSYLVRTLGGTWGAVAQTVFLTGAALVLVAAVLSHQVRAWARVMVAKYIFPYRYDYRAEWRKLTEALSATTDEPIHERVTHAMSALIHCGAGGLWLRDAHGTYVPAGGDLAPPDGPQESGAAEFLEWLRTREWIYDLEELRGGRNRGGAPLPPAWLLDDQRFSFIVPLVCGESLVGFVVLGQPLVAIRLTWEEIDLLRAAGRQVASHLAFEQAAKRLAEAQQFEAVNRLTTVLMHDLRHLIAQQALVVQNAARHRHNPEFIDDAILTIDSSVKRMTRLMEDLRSGVLTEQARRVELGELCAELVRRTATRRPAPRLDVSDREIEVILDRDRLLDVLEHVVRNAQDATPEDGTVSVIVRRAAQHAVIEVADTGIGMDAEFIRTRLFRPFDTTKGKEGMGIGAYEAREFVRKCGGSVDVESAPGRGTRFIIRLPVAPPLSAGHVA